MAVTQQDIDRLTAAIATGEKQVVIGNQSVTYRSIEELFAARAQLIKDLEAQQVDAGEAVPKPRTYNMVYGGRGYEDC